jgi:hypothetical protein
MKIGPYPIALAALLALILASVLFVLFPPAPEGLAHGPSPAPETLKQDLPPAPEPLPVYIGTSSCLSGDGCCPEGCTALMDYDCPAYPLGETVELNGLQLRVDFIEERRCIGFSGNEDYLYYLVFHAKAKNLLNHSQFVSYPSFYLMDTNGSKHSPDPVLPYYSCRDDYQELLLDTKFLQPGQAVSGEVWVEIDKEADPLDGILRLVYDPTPSSEGDEFVYLFNYTR